MKLHLGLTAIFVVFCHQAFTNSLVTQSINENPAHTFTITKTKAQPSLLSVFLYLPLTDSTALSSIMARSQLQVMPTADYTVNNILVYGFSSKNGSCTRADANGSYVIGDIADPTVTLFSTMTYSTTDASSRAVYIAGNSFFAGVAPPNADGQFQLRNGTTNVGALSTCIAGNNTSACTSVTNCGWNTQQTWTP